MAGSILPLMRGFAPRVLAYADRHFEAACRKMPAHITFVTAACF
jgi:hypothetical protein